MKLIEMKVGGIKCDSCDWADMTVIVSDYEKYLNMPCPKCGANLLTEADYSTTMAIMALVDRLNTITPEQPEDARRVSGKIKMDGTGSVEIEIDNPRQAGTERI